MKAHCDPLGHGAQLHELGPPLEEDAHRYGLEPEVGVGQFQVRGHDIEDGTFEVRARRELLVEAQYRGAVVTLTGSTGPTATLRTFPHRRTLAGHR
ncbi:MAG: hypothetical protein ACI91O_001108 [Candidatus Poriferisodalaceae bacterium]|jgi:hypothetical protein